MANSSNKVLPSIVGIEVEYQVNSIFSRNPQTSAASGSGIIISEDGYILTNNHVIELEDYAKEMKEKGIEFSDHAKTELDALCAATTEIVAISYNAFIEDNAEQANLVEPLEQVIDRITAEMRSRFVCIGKNCTQLCQLISNKALQCLYLDTNVARYKILVQFQGFAADIITGQQQQVDMF